MFVEELAKRGQNRYSPIGSIVGKAAVLLSAYAQECQGLVL